MIDNTHTQPQQRRTCDDEANENKQAKLDPMQNIDSETVQKRTHVFLVIEISGAIQAQPANEKCRVFTTVNTSARSRHS